MTRRAFCSLAGLAALCCMASFTQAGQQAATASAQPKFLAAKLHGIQGVPAVQNVRRHPHNYRSNYGYRGNRSPTFYRYRYPFGYQGYIYPAYRFGYGYTGRGFSYGRHR